MVDEAIPSGQPRPKTQEHGIVTYIHGVKPITRNKEGKITDGEVEPNYAKHLTKILGLGNLDNVDYQIALVDQELYELYDGVRKRGKAHKDMRTSEGVMDSVMNRVHYTAKVSNSKDGFAEKNIVTSISISEQESRFQDVKPPGGGLLGGLFHRGGNKK